MLAVLTDDYTFLFIIDNPREVIFPVRKNLSARLLLSLFLFDPELSSLAGLLAKLDVSSLADSKKDEMSLLQGFFLAG